MIPKISIITICYNAEKDIEDTMESVLNQTYKNIEYIIKDGLSTDETMKKIYEMTEKYKNREIKVVSSNDLGIYDAMNQALEYCSGEWIAFMNAGDRYYTNTIVYEMFSEAQIGSTLIYGDTLVQDISGNGVWIGDISKITRKMPFGHASCFMKKDIIQMFKFDTKYKIAADYNLVFDIYKLGGLFSKIDRIIAVFDTKGISSTKYIKNIQERNMVRCLHGVRIPKNELLVDYMLAYMKQIIVCFMPIKLQLNLRKCYMRMVKKYKEADASK